MKEAGAALPTSRGVALTRMLAGRQVSVLRRARRGSLTGRHPQLDAPPNGEVSPPQGRSASGVL